MMRAVRAFTAVTLVVLMTGTGRASKPSPGQLAQDSIAQTEREHSKASAAPWQDSLTVACSGFADSNERAEAPRLLFLATYKHFGSGEQVKAAGKAAAFAEAWTTLAREGRAAGLDPVSIGEAIYRFTNSDWAPVSATKGPGLDRVKTAKDYLAWGRAVITAGKRALQVHADPSETWQRQAASYKVRKPADLAKVGLHPNPVRF
jgi:hypothetical protein